MLGVSDARISVISLYYYIKIIREIYIKSPLNEGMELPVPYLDRVSLTLFLVIIVAGGVYPTLLSDFIQSATDVVISSELIRVI